MHSCRLASFNINRFAKSRNPPPWPTGLGRYRFFFNPEILGSSPGVAEDNYFIFLMHISSVLTFAHGVLC